MLVLKALIRGPLHGYAVAEFIHQTSDDVLRVEEGALYPALHRLELRGLVVAEWGLSDNNRRAKFYQLTAAGREHLAAEAETWTRLTAAVARILTATSTGTGRVMRETLNQLRLRLKAMLRQRQLDRDLDDEMAFHLAMREQANRATGLTPDDAR